MKKPIAIDSDSVVSDVIRKLLDTKISRALVSKGKFDHIVMSTTGTGGAKNEMFGSVSNYVAHKAKIPIYLVK